jgi:hypothetical protein
VKKKRVPERLDVFDGHPCFIMEAKWMGEFS